MSDFEDQVLNSLQKIEQNISSLQQEVRRVEVILESHEEKFDQSIEIISPEIQKNNEQNLLLENHDTRITSLEAART